MKSSQVGVWIGVILAVVIVGFFFMSFFSRALLSDVPHDADLRNIDTLTMPEVDDQFVTITEVEEGSGAEAIPGTSVTVHYTGTFEDGTVFDSSVSRGEPFQFTLGVGQVIRGWDRGVAGMKVGGKRTLVIQPEYAYGSQGIKNPQTGEYLIPENAVLTFEIELLGVQSIN